MKKKYLIKDNEIVYYSNSRGFVTVLKTQANYKDILDYLLDPNFKEAKFLEMVDNGFDIEKESKGKIKKVKDGAVIGEINIPPAILKKIEELRSKGYEWRHYQKFWERCLKNPNPKSVEQRIRRAAFAGMVNLANKGMEDYADPVFNEYAGRLYNFEQIRKEMNYIRGKSDKHGNVRIRNFISGLLAYCREM